VDIGIRQHDDIKNYLLCDTCHKVGRKSEASSAAGIGRGYIKPLDTGFHRYDDIYKAPFHCGECRNPV
jgi:hypothetical protein